jgi:hypothetical protein
MTPRVGHTCMEGVCVGGGGGSVGIEDGHREVREDKHGEADHEEEEGCMAV